MVEAGRGGGREVNRGRGWRYPWTVEPLGADRYLGAGYWQKRGFKQTRYTATTGMWRRNPGAGRDLVSRLRTTREVISEASGGSQWVGAMSRWKDAPRPGELGWRSRSLSLSPVTVTR